MTATRRKSSAFSQGLALFRREMAIRYRRTKIGPLWSVIPTILAGASISLTVEHIGIEFEGSVPTPLAIFFNLVLFQLFAESIAGTLKLTLRCRNFLRFVPFRYEALSVAGLYFTLLNFAVRSFVLIGLLAFFERAPHPSGLAALVAGGVALVSLGIAISQILTPLSLVFWDVRYFQGYLLAIATFATPVFYPFKHEGLMGRINAMNPLTYIINVPADLFFSGKTSYLSEFLVSVGVSVVLLIASVFYFRKGIVLATEHI